MDAPLTGDADLWLGLEPAASRAMLLAAVESFAARGYHATTTRSIAERAGLSPAAVYVHYRSKVDLLCEINLIGHAGVLRDIERALEGVEACTERLRALTRAFVSWHARNHTLARVIQYERQAIPLERYGEIRQFRRRFETIFRSELQRGVDRGEFSIDELDTTTVALLSLGIDVARWYTGKGRTPDDLGAAYGEIALRMVGAGAPPSSPPPADARSRGVVAEAE